MNVGLGRNLWQTGMWIIYGDATGVIAFALEDVWGTNSPMSIGAEMEVGLWYKVPKSNKDSHECPYLKGKSQ